MFERDGNRNGERVASLPRGGPLRFGTDIDPVEAGRRGGLASAASRKLRAQRQLEERIIASRNGAAHAALLRIRREDEAALLRERRRADEKVRQADETVSRLMDWREEEEQRLAELRDECAEQERRIAELRARLESDEGLDAFLLEVGEERLEASARRLGWVEPEPGDVAA